MAQKGGVCLTDNRFVRDFWVNGVGHGIGESFTQRIAIFLKLGYLSRDFRLRIAESEASIRTYDAASTPSAFLGTQHAHHACNLVFVRRPASHLLASREDFLWIDSRPCSHQRRVLGPRFDCSEEGFPSTIKHICRHRARVYRVNGRSLAQLAGPGPRHGVQRCLCSAIDGLALEAARGGHGRDVDDSARAVVGQVRHGSLHEQQRAQHIDGI